MAASSSGMSRQPSLTVPGQHHPDPFASPPSSLRPPSLILSHASSSSASSSASSSSIKHTCSPPQHRSRPPRPAPPPPPPPSRFLFWPDPVPIPTPLSGRPRFAFGWVGGTTAVVAGVMEADDRAEAERRLGEVGLAFGGRRAGRGLRVIGSCSSPEGIGLGLNLGGGKGKEKAREGEDEGEPGLFPGWVNLELAPDSPYPTVTIAPPQDSDRPTAADSFTHPHRSSNGHPASPPAPPHSPTTPSRHPTRSATHPRPLPITTVLYTPPSRSQLQFFSLTPLQLDLNSFSARRPRRRRRSVSSVVAVAEHAADKAQSERAALVAKLKRTTHLDFASPTEGGAVLAGGVVDLAEVVDWINLAPELAAAFSPRPSRPSLRRLPFSPALARTSRLLLHPARALRALCKGVLLVTNYELPGLGGTALKDVSATAQQVDTRVSQVLAWPGQYALIRATLTRAGEVAGSSGAGGAPGGGAGREEETAAGLALGRAHYIQFYNTMWLIANDMIVGTAATSFVCENADFLGTRLGALVRACTLEVLRDLLLWLNDWPGGVKLNFELASIFCDAFLWATRLWEELILTPLLPHLPTIVYLLGLSGLLGTTLFFSLASDLLSLLTLHVFAFYFMATSLFRWHLALLGALFNLFRGRKFNVLRRRVEPAVYDVDQLLLGTILFTLASFLFPTVLVYYLAFASSRVMVVALHAAMEAGLAFMNHFPLFAVMLRFKDPARLPGGLRFAVEEEDRVGQSGGAGAQEAAGLRLRLTNHPVHLAGIFFQHLQLSRRLASHYSPFYLLGRLASGRVISPIPRVRLRLDTGLAPEDA